MVNYAKLMRLQRQMRGKGTGKSRYNRMSNMIGLQKLISGNAYIGGMKRPRKLSAYNMFVKANMPAALRQTGSAPDAMRLIGQKWSNRR